MLEGNRFGHLIPGNTTPSTSAPTFIPAPPKIPTPSEPDTPQEAEAKRLDIELKKQRLAKGLVDPGEAELKAAEQKAAFLTTNLIGNVNIMQRAVTADPTATAPTWDQLAVGILGQDVKNSYLPAQRQVIENSQRLITDAALTLGTGAAYTPEQIEAYRRGFFPQVGDSQEAISAKREALRTALVAARIGAGSGAAKIDEAMAALGLSIDPLADPGKLPTEVDTGAPKPVLDEQGRPLMELNIKNPTGPTADEKRAEAYRQKQDRTFGPESHGKTLTVHGMSGTLSDEAAGIGTGLSYLLTGQNPIEGYTTGRDAERLRIQDARDQLGGWGTAAEIGGGFLSFNPTVAMAPAASALATITQGAKAGAAGGSVFGYGSGEGFSDSVEKAAIGSVFGGALGAAVPLAGMGVSRMAGPRAMDPDLAAAARAENVRLRSPMLDDNARRIKMGKLEGTAGGAPVIQRAVRETTDDIEAAAARVGGPGQLMETGPAGERIQQASRNFIQRTKGVADRLYDVARKRAGNVKIDPVHGRMQADQELAALRENADTNAGEIQFLEGLIRDLTPRGGKTVQGLRDLRTSIRGRINEMNLTATQAEARAHRVLDAVHQDLANLPNGASSAFRRADTYYRERMIHIDDVLDRFIGTNKAGQTRLSGEQAFKQLRNMTSNGGDARRLAALWRDMTPNEQADVAATIMRTIGRRGDDATDATAPFSVDLFISQASTLSPSARRTIFGPSGAASVNRLITLSRALQASQKEVNKTKSGSTPMRAMGSAIAAALLGGGGGAVAGGAGTGGLIAAGTIAGMGAKLGLNNLSARALMSPRVSLWLSDVANATTPSQIQALSRRLGVIASREPALAAELAPIQQALAGQARPVPLAASESEGEQ